MEFFNYTKNLIKQKENEKDKIYKINPFKQKKDVTFIWVESPKENDDKE
ncbi:MAG: hypothetical protein ACI37S_03165 [Candidatus Gastranaerophilaceae bacterium]